MKAYDLKAKKEKERLDKKAALEKTSKPLKVSLNY
jgi:hypothetical protein